MCGKNVCTIFNPAFMERQDLPRTYLQNKCPLFLVIYYCFLRVRISILQSWLGFDEAL